MAQDCADAKIGPFDDAFDANILNTIKGMLADKGLSADLVDRTMLLTTTSSKLATEYDSWCDLLRDPLFLSPSILQRLLKLRDSNARSPPPLGHVTIFYIRTFALTVNQLQCVLRVLIDAKILFTGRVFEWQARIANIAGESPVYLRYAEVVSSCLIQEIPHLEIVMDLGHPPIFIREQLVICLIERGALNMTIGGTASSTLDTRDKRLFQSLKTDLVSKRYAATKEASGCMGLAIQDYARQAVHMGPKIGKMASKPLVDMIAKQAIPRTLKNGQALLLLIGYCPPGRALNAVRPFWDCGRETPRVLLNLIDHLCQWEEKSSEFQLINAENLMVEGFLPFVNFHPIREADETGFEPALNVLKSYLQVVRPLIGFTMGYQVADIGFRHFSPQPSHGLSRRNFSARVGSLSIQHYANETTPLDNDDCYFIQITSYHPGALSFGVSQRPMQRVFNMTMFKAWLTASVALKYSDSTFHGRPLCEQVIGAVERRLKMTYTNGTAAASAVQWYEKGYLCEEVIPYGFLINSYENFSQTVE